MCESEGEEGKEKKGRRRREGEEGKKKKGRRRREGEEGKKKKRRRKGKGEEEEGKKKKGRFSSDLHEGEDEADGEVGQPVEAAGHRVGRRSVRLLEELGGDQEGDAGCDTTHTGGGVSQENNTLNTLSVTPTQEAFFPPQSHAARWVLWCSELGDRIVHTLGGFPLPRRSLTVEAGGS